MSDLRGISRGSKAAAIVVLVVLVQVVVLAFLGLGAIRNDREEGARRAAESELRKAGAVAEETRRRAWEGLRGDLEKAAVTAREQPDGFRNETRAGWFRAFLET